MTAGKGGKGMAAAGGSEFFAWKHGTNGKAFVSMPSTPKSKTALANLTPLSTYGFLVGITNPDGTLGPWSQVVTTLVR